MSRLREIDVAGAVAVMDGMRDDSPVSGGVGAVLARGRGFGWTGEQDAALLQAAPEEVPALAREIGVSLSMAQTRKAVLEAGIMGMMA